MKEVVTTPPAPLFGLETPHPLQPTQNYFQLVGWAFLPRSEADLSPEVNGGSASAWTASETDDTVTERSDRARVVPPHHTGRTDLQRIGHTANQVRIVVGQETFLPVERIDRPDVVSTFPNEAAALGSGFKFICYLPFGFYTGRLEISTVLVLLYPSFWRR